jgi:hypothetical protein
MEAYNLYEKGDIGVYDFGRYAARASKLVSSAREQLMYGARTLAQFDVLKEQVRRLEPEVRTNREKAQRLGILEKLGFNIGKLLG